MAGLRGMGAGHHLFPRMDRKRNHLAVWSVSFAAASLGVWLTWMNYLSFGLRFRMPAWVLLWERPLCVAELLYLLFGAVFTAYHTGLFVKSDEPGAVRT